jgi:hypothetical protein
VTFDYTSTDTPDAIPTPSYYSRFGQMVTRF